MKFLSVFFLAGLALCYAFPDQETRELRINEIQELDLLLGEVLDEERSSRDVKETLKNMFDRLMEKVAEMTEKGKEVNSGLVERVKNLLEKLKDKGIDLKEKIRERGGGLPEKAKELWNKFMEKLGIGEKENSERSSRDVKETLKNMFDRLMEKVAEMTEKGKEVNSGLVERVKNLLEKLKDKGIDLKEKIRERGGGLPEKAKELWNKFMEKLGIGEKEDAEVERSARDVKETLKNMFDRLMEKVAEMTEKGKEVNSGLVERVKNLLEKLKDKGIDLKEKIRERGGSLPEKAKELWNNFLEKLGIGEKEDAEAQRSERDVRQTLRDMFDRLMEKVTEITGKGKEVNGGLINRIKKVFEKLKDKGIDLTDKIRERGGSLPEKAKDLFKKFLDRLGIGEKGYAEGERSTRDAKDTLKNMFDRLLEMVTDSTERGREISEGLAGRIKNLFERAKNLGLDFTEKIRERGQSLSGKARELYNKFLEQIGIGGTEEENAIEEEEDAIFAEGDVDDDDIQTELGRALRDHLLGILEHIRESIERGKEVHVETVEKLRAIRLKLRELRVELGLQAKELLQKIKVKGKSTWEKIKGIFGGKNRQESEEDTKGRFGKYVDKVMERLGKFLEKGRELRQKVVDRVKDMLQKMKDVEFGDSEINEKFTSLLGRLSQRGKEALKKLMERLGINREERMIEFSDFEKRDADDDMKEKFGKIFDKILGSLKILLESGRELREKIVDRVKDMIQKMKDVGVDDSEISGKFSGLMGKLSERGKEALKKLMERLGINREERMIEFADDDVDEIQTELGRALRDHLIGILQHIKESIERGKEVKEEALQNLREIYKKMKELKVELNLQAKELLQKIKEKGKKTWEKIKSIFRKKTREERDADDDMKDKFGKIFDKILGSLKILLESGRELREKIVDRVKDMIQKMKDVGVDDSEISGKFSGLMGKLSERGKEALKKLMERLGINREERMVEFADLQERDADDDMKEKFGKIFDKILGSLKILLESGRELREKIVDRVKDMIQKMKDVGVDDSEISGKFSGLMGKLSERGKEALKKLMERLGISREERMIEFTDLQERDADDDMKEKFGKIFDKILGSLKILLESGRELREKIVDRVKDMIQKMKDVGMDDSEISGKFSGLMGKLSERGKEALKKLLERLGINREERMIEFVDDDEEEDIEKIFKENVQHFLNQLKKILEYHSFVRVQRVANAMKVMIQKMKDFGMDDSEISQAFTDLYEELSDKAKKSLDKLLEIVGIKKAERSIALADDDGEEEVKDRLAGILKKVLDKLKNVLENHRGISKQMVDRMKDMVEKLKKVGMGDSAISKTFTDLFEKLNDTGKKALSKLMVILGIKKAERSIEFADDDGGEDVRERMGGILQKFLDKIKNVLEKNRGLSQRLVDRLKDMVQRMKSIGIGDSDISRKFTDLFEKLTDKGKKALDKLMKRLGIKKAERMIEYDEEEDDDEDDGVKGRMGRILRQFLDKLKNVLESNRNISQRIVERIKDMIKKMKNVGLGDSDISSKFSDLFKKLTDKGKKALDKLMTRLGLKKEERMIEFADDGENPEVSKDLREKFEDLVQKIKDALENGRSFRDGLEKLKEIRERLKELKGKLGDKAKDLVEKLREKIKEYFQKWMDKFNGRQEMSLKDVYENIKEYFRNLQIDLKERFVKFGEWAKEKLEKGLERGKDRAETLKKLAREFIHDTKLWGKDTVLQAKYFFREYKGDLGELYVVVKEKIKEKLESIEVYERVRDYLRNLDIELREKFAKFGEWAKEKFEKGLDQGKDRAENLKNLARQFIHDAKVIGKDVAKEAKEFFREYKEELGTIYDRVHEKVKEILDRQD